MESNRWMTLTGTIIVAVIVIGLVTFKPNTNNEPTSMNTPETPTGQTLASDEAKKNKQYLIKPEMLLEQGKDYQATLQTSEGTIVIDLFEDRVPQTVNSFVFLANEGYFDGVIFHRIIEGFMIQTGDPTGTGSGGPGYTFEDEPFEGEYLRGTVAMANAGPDTNGSQFFIMHQEYALPPSYTIFGQVVEGIEVVDAIAQTPVVSNAYGEVSKPSERISIESITITSE
jgi:cyclophilin family peptidyl-prolyl cis-trans isomerase